MKQATLILLAALLSLAWPAWAAPAKPASDRSPGLAIVGVTVLPMTEGPASIADQTVLIRDGKIVEVGARRRVKIPGGWQTIDARGQYLMPGLSDMHVHLEYIENPDILKLFVAAGVTSVRSMDGRPFIRQWRDRVRAGELVGPQIYTAGPIIDGAPPARDDNLAVADGAAARAAVADQAAKGYDFIKLYTNLSPPAYAAAVDEARRRGLKVAGHVPRGVPLDQALAASWSIEHLGDFAALLAKPGSATPGWARRAIAAPLDQERLTALTRQLVARRTWVVPTTIQQDRWLGPPAALAGWLAEPAIRNLPPSVLAQWRGANDRFAGRLDAADWAMLDQARQNRLAVVRALHRAGVPLVVGTDTPNPFVAMGASVHQELANFVAAGLTPLEALKAATIAPARMLGREAEQGTVEKGKRADLLLLADNPLNQIVSVARPAGLVIGGRWLSKEQLAALPRSVTIGR